jgi:hypothetical protein
MTGAQLQNTLLTIGWSVRATEERFGLREKTITRMLRGEAAIPEWFSLRMGAIAAVISTLTQPPSKP